MTIKSNEEVMVEFDRIFVDENVWEGEDEYTKNVPIGNIKAFIISLRKADMEAVRGLIEKKMHYWHIRFEGISDEKVSAERKAFNEQITTLVNGILLDLLKQLPDSEGKEV